MEKKRSYNLLLDTLSKLTSQNIKIDSSSEFIIKNEKYKILQIIAKSSLNKQNVLLSAGIHGFEPAGIYALERFLNYDIYKFLSLFNFYIFPCINPSGFEYDTLTNLAGLDLNRQFRKKKPPQEIMIIKKALLKGPKNYLFTVDLHEVNPTEEGEGFLKKDNPTAFYIYEYCKEKDLRAGQTIIKHLEKDIPICRWKTIYGDINNNGVVFYPESNRNPIYKKNVTFDQYLFLKYTKQAFIFETPVGWSLSKRISIHIKALKILLNLKSK